MDDRGLRTVRIRMRTDNVMHGHHPLVHGFAAIQRCLGLRDKDLFDKAGVTNASQWRNGVEPGIINFDSGLRAMGFRLVIARLEEEPAEIIISRRVPA